MKNIIKFNISLILAFALIFSGCKWIDSDLNIDPNNPTDVPMSLMLPSLQTSAAYAIGGNNAVRITNMWVQQFDGVDRQSLVQARYQITSADVNDLWEVIYAQSMMDCKTLIAKADEQASPYWAGIGKVMLAMDLGVLTNFFGDMPYTEAFMGSQSNLQPIYDSQESIYTSINTLLDEAIVHLAETENAVDVESDLIYEGDIAMWTKAAHALKARFALYLGNYDVAIAEADLSFEYGEDFSFAFDDTEIGANPIYQFMSQRVDIRMASTFIDYLIAEGDPRLSFYSAGNVGSIPGSEDPSASVPGVYNSAINSPVVFSSYAETQFIKAEAIFQRDGAFNADALTAFQNGADHSVTMVAGDNQAWLDAHINNETTGTLTLEDVITQKWVAMYSTVVPYDDWRRTGYPDLLPVIGAITATPVRFPYPQSEITYNENCPSGIGTLDELWIFNH